MKTISRYMLSVILLLSLNACIMTEPKKMFNNQEPVEIDLSLFTEDKTSKSEIRSALGDPSMEDIRGDGKSMFMYTTVCPDRYYDCFTTFTFEDDVYKWSQSWSKKYK